MLSSDLPPELLGCIAEYLEPRELYATALVCGHWRASLLGMSLLWTRICIAQRDGQASCRRLSTADILHALFARSQGLPLHIELLCTSTEPLDEYNALAATLKGQMHRIRSLSVIVPVVKAAFAHILRTPAPILECFRLHSGEAGTYRLPADLFARNAPRLARVSLSGLDLPSGTGCPALRAVTDLVYDARVIESVHLKEISVQFPALQSLTLLAYQCYVVRGLMKCLLPARLRLPNISRISTVVESFPNAPSVCLYSSQQFWDETELEALADSLEHITSVGVYCRSQRQLVSAGVGPLTAPTNLGWIAVSVNGVDIAVDLPLSDAKFLVRELSYRFQDVRSVTAHESLCQQLAWYELPALEELTLHLSYPAEVDEKGDAYSAPWRWAATYLLRETDNPFPKQAAALLRLIAPTGSRLLDLQESIVTAAIQALCEPRVLRTLVLRGVGLDVQYPAEHPRSLYSLVPGLEIKFEAQGVDDRSEPWCWTLAVDDAVHV